jgi:V8-like Glu-specific endopeptidase
MADTDLVKHDLKIELRAAAIDLDEYNDPVPFTRGEQGSSPRVAAALTDPPVTTRVSDEDLVKAPYRSVGKMGLVLNGKKKGATGWVVAPRAFITAGHCVYTEELGGWITQAFLAPRYNNAVDTLYTGVTVYTFKGWTESEKRAYDMAACVVTEKFAKTEPPLAFDTGVLPGLNFAVIGYPIRPIPDHDFNGKRMWKCVGDLIRAGGGVQWAANNLTGGSSGGPWCETGNKYIVSGLTSYRDDDPNEACSPLFANTFEILYDAVKDL